MKTKSPKRHQKNIIVRMENEKIYVKIVAEYLCACMGNKKDNVEIVGEQHFANMESENLIAETVGGKAFCEHGKNKYICKECHGSSICDHGRRRSICKECDGVAICEHGRIKYSCKECDGISICDHGNRKQYCKECEGISICDHGKYKEKCKECEGSSFCVHGKCKQYCNECGGSSLCTNCKDVKGSSKYDGHCLRCFIYLFPDIPVYRNYKTKETAVKDFILEKFSNLNWIPDKRVYDGCSKRRPDILLDLGYQVIIIEVDEDKHNAYECSCENKRIMEISQDVGHRPIVFLRFNPDSYVNMDGEKIGSCWGTLKTGIDTVKKEKKEEWEIRLDCLKSQIKYWINPKNKTNKMIETVQLYYDGFNDQD